MGLFLRFHHLAQAKSSHYRIMPKLLFDVLSSILVKLEIRGFVYASVSIIDLEKRHRAASDLVDLRFWC